MYTRDYRDLIAGGILFAIGGVAAINAMTSYPLGSLRHMGLGMFPAMLGGLLTLLGLFVMLPALFRGGTLERPDIQPLLAVCASVTVFALTIRSFGLAPAVLLTTLMAVMADRKLGLMGSAILAVVLSTFAVVIFIYGLGMPIRIFTIG